MTETPDDDDVLAPEADDGRKLTHAIVYRPRVPDRLAAEDVFVEDRDLVGHFFSVLTGNGGSNSIDLSKVKQVVARIQTHEIFDALLAALGMHADAFQLFRRCAID